MNFNIGKYQSEREILCSYFQNEKVAERIWQKDYTLWSDKPDEITNRLGWLTSPTSSMKLIDEINEFVSSVQKDGFKKTLLLGMGGSSLAPEVFRLTFGVKDGYLDLAVLDSTDPKSVKYFENNYTPEETLFIVSTKSGSTVETFSFMKYFYNQTLLKVGKEKVGNHFVAITDPNSGLETIAKELNFRKIFLNDPNIGGRYSALSLFGIVPAALIGVELKNILQLAEAFSFTTKIGNCNDNVSSKLGLIIGLLAKNKVDKLTFINSQKLAYFGAWVEQLIAESTGKVGKGILPVVGEEILEPSQYSTDRVFVYFHYQNENDHSEKIKALSNAGFPIIEITIKECSEIGAEFFRWEFATIVASWVMKIQPFDQPNVESAKVVARKMVQDFKETGNLKDLPISCEEDGIKITSPFQTLSIKEQLEKFLSLIQNNDNTIPLPYVAIQAYIQMNKSNEELLQKVRTAIQLKYKVATTLGFGPRFLHSTGQLHKGDAGNGLFIQFIYEPENDVPIPDEAEDDKSSISFGVLIKSQAFGDRQALLDNNRKIITINLGKNIQSSLEKIIEYLN